MGEDVAISLRNVSKCFKRYAHPVDRLKELLLPKRSFAQEFWALRDINLEIPQGEAIGIVGQNGAGKSTLLQIIAGTLTSTTGEVSVRGRISALLELGSGFNPEFTGRQNVFFNGRLLGLSQKEVENKFDEIASFADIGDFIDQPVKTYSSGMFVRLAFAVAINVEPNILIVDEALAVGDIYFQQKCFERIRQLKDSGATFFFVSHDSTTIYKLCKRAILLEHGSIVLDAKPKQVIDLYEANLLRKVNSEAQAISIQAEAEANILLSKDPISEQKSDLTQPQPDLLEPDLDTSISSPAVDIKTIKLLNEEGQELSCIVSDQTVQLLIEILCLDSLDSPHIGFKIRGRTGEVIFETNTFCMTRKIGSVAPNTLLRVCFKFKASLAAGEYSITIGVADDVYGTGQFKRILVYSHDTVFLSILRNQNAITWAGIVNLNPSVSVQQQVPLAVDHP